MPAKPKYEYRLVPLHCTEAGVVTLDDATCINDAGEHSWKAVPGSVHQFGKKWRVLMEREK